MIELKKYLRKFFESKLNICILATVCLLLVFLLLSIFSGFFMTMSIIIFSLIFIEFGIKCFILNRKKEKDYGVFFDVELSKNSNKKKYMYIGVALFVVSFIMLISLLRNLLK